MRYYSTIFTRVVKIRTWAYDPKRDTYVLSGILADFFQVEQAELFEELELALDSSNSEEYFGKTEFSPGRADLVWSTTRVLRGCVSMSRNTRHLSTPHAALIDMNRGLAYLLIESIDYEGCQVDSDVSISVP